MAKFLGIDRVRLLNDLEATGYGIEVMTPKDIETIHAGVSDAGGTRVVIAAGTGLGRSDLILGWQRGICRWRPKAGTPISRRKRINKPSFGNF